MILTKEEQEILMKERNIYFVELVEELRDYLIKEGSGYKIEFVLPDYDWYKVNEFKEKENILDTLCICGLSFSSKEYFACPICNNHKFRNQKINFDDFVECYEENKPLKNIKKKLFNEGYSYEKESETRYKLYREKESFTYDWLTHEFKIIKEKNKKLVGYIEKTDEEFYVVKDNKKTHIVHFAKNIKQNKSLDFIRMYNDLNKERPLPVIECKGFELAYMIMDDKLRIVCEYFNSFIDIDIDSILTHYYYGSILSWYSYKSIISEIDKSSICFYPIDKNLYNIYNAIGLPKSIIKFIKNKFDEHKNTTILQRMLYDFVRIIHNNKEEPNNAIKLYEQFKFFKDTHHLDKFYQIKKRYKHEFKHLFNYLEKINKQQGINVIDALGYYYDYINSSSLMGVPYTKYPKNLMKVHDIRMKDFKIIESKENNKLFKNSYKSNRLEQNKIDNFVFLEPLEPVELTFEGQNLNHCVASYVDRVIKHNSLIYFMRDKEFPNVSLVTIEYNKLLNKIVQVRGKFNRHPTEEERAVIKQWAKANNLIY